MWIGSTPLPKTAGTDILVSATISIGNVSTLIPWIYSAPGGVYKLKAIKLEQGPVQTLAHQDADGNWVLNAPPPNKALELLKCQQYYLGFSRWEFWPIVDVQQNYIDFSIPGPVKMRTAPSIHNLVSNWLDSSWSLSAVVNGSSVIRVRAYKENHGLTAPIPAVEAADYAGLSADL